MQMHADVVGCDTIAQGGVMQTVLLNVLISGWATPIHEDTNVLFISCCIR